MTIINRQQCIVSIADVNYEDVLLSAEIIDGLAQDNYCKLRLSFGCHLSSNCYQQPLQLTCGSLCLFSGIIQEYCLHQDIKQQYYQVTAFSNSHVLHQAMGNQLFTQQSTKYIIQKLCQPYPIDCQFHGDFSTQHQLINKYQQSAYDSICDLLAKESAWFYANNQQLIIGKGFEDRTPIALSFKTNSNLAATQACVTDIHQTHKIQSLQQPYHIKESVNAKTTCATLRPQDVITLQDHPLTSLNQDWRVIVVKHRITNHYHNECQLQSLNQSFTCQAPTKRYFALQCATVHGQKPTEANLDATGRYQLCFPYQDKPVSAQIIKKLCHFTGDGYGHHFPLTHNSRVLVAFIDGNINQPVIVGSLNNHDNPNLVTQHNQQQQLLQFSKAQHLCLTDNKHNPSLLLQNHQQSLLLQNQPSQLSLSNHQGSMQWDSAHEQRHQAQQLAHWHIDGRSQYSVKQNIAFTAQRITWRNHDSNIHINHRDDTEITCQQLQLQSEQLQWQCKQLDIHCQNYVTQQIRQYHCQSPQICWEFAQKLLIQCGQSTILIYSNGDMTMSSDAINIISQQTFSNQSLLQVNTNK